MLLRPLLAGGLLLSVAIAGCLGTSSPEPPVPLTASDQPLRTLPQPAGNLEPFQWLLCQQDIVANLASTTPRDGCNTKVTLQNGPAAEVHLAANPRDPLNLVGGAKDFTLKDGRPCDVHNVWGGVYWTFDGGRTWGNGLLPGYVGDARTTVLSEYDCASDPVLAFGPEGNVYYASIAFTLQPQQIPLPGLLGPFTAQGEKTAVVVTRSRDGGATWDDPVLVDRRGPEGFLDKEWIDVDPATGQVYVTWIDAGGANFFVSRSDDQGMTWTEPVLIVGGAGEGLNPIPTLRRQFGQVAVGPGGAVHFTYYSHAEKEGLPAVFHRLSRDGGQTWSEPHAVGGMVPLFDVGLTHKYRQVGMAALAVDRSTGTLHVAWPTPNAAGGFDVLAASSTDEGATWSMPKAINDDLSPPTNGQWMVAIAVGHDGVVHATWIDYRDDPAGQSAYIYYAHSKDGGQTWSKNFRLSDKPFDGTGGYHQNGSGTIGDYMGLVATPEAVFPFWADTRTGRNDVFSAIILAT